MKNIIFNICVICMVISVNGQSLDEYLREAEENSLDIQAGTFAFLAAQEKENEVGSLGNTKFGIGVFAQEVETRVGPQKIKLSVGQNFPWFGTLQAKKELASQKSNSARIDIAFSKQLLYLNVKRNYYALFDKRTSISILEEQLLILSTLENIALKELENNKATMVDVINIKMEKNLISQSISTAKEELNALKSTFNLLLNKNDHSPIKIPDHLEINQDFMSNNYSFNQNPTILKLENKADILQSEMDLVEKEKLPNFSFGLDYAVVTDRPIDNLQDNGKDIIMPMLSMSVPIFSKKFDSKRKQLVLEEKRVKALKDQAINELQSQFELALSALKNAEIAYNTQSENLIQADQAKKLLLAAYKTATLDFDKILELERMILKFKLKQQNSIADFYIQKSLLEFLTANKKNNSHEKI